MQSNSAGQQSRPQTAHREVVTQRPVMVVLGGNAFAGVDGPLTMDGQFQFARKIMHKLAPLFAGNRPVVITHGNGPQVGYMLARVAGTRDRAYEIPLGVCVAETEGELGYVLQQTLHNVLVEAGTTRRVVSLLTQVMVSEQDPSFRDPTKAVGSVCSQQEVQKLKAQGIAVREDVGRGPRRMVPSPVPIEIIETDIIRDLLAAGVVVVAAGGGGIPVVRSDGLLRGVDAVVDKDLASALLGEQLGATEMITITDVPCAYQNFLGESQVPIETIGLPDAQRLIAEGHFAAGSMRPKMEAACQFCRRPGTRAVICSPDNLEAALRGDAGTVIVGPQTC